MLYWFPGFAIMHAVNAVRINELARLALKRNGLAAGMEQVAALCEEKNVARYSIVLVFALQDAQALHLCMQCGLDERAAHDRIASAHAAR